MARYTGAVCRLCRREGTKLFFKGRKMLHRWVRFGASPVCSRSARPGQKEAFQYGLQLREKQKARRYYGILESQFHKYFEMANKKQALQVITCLQFWRADLITLFTDWDSEHRVPRQDSLFCTVTSPLTVRRLTFLHT